MIDKGINIKKIDLSGVSFPTNDASTCALIYTAVKNTYGFPLYLTNFKINDEKRDSVLVNPIIEEDKTIVNLNDCHLVVTPTEISVGKGVYSTSLESIVDSHGNKRFVEGDITMETISGVSKIYGKWSLSGTHLMIRLILNLANNTTLAASSKICTINLPQWVINKIIPIFDTYINISTFVTVGGGSDTTIKLSLRKFNTNTLAIYTSAGQYVSMRDERLEIQFDLLIDSE